MMNRSKIDWTDFSWNPVTGCRHNCAYCYARKQAKRFCGDIRLNKASKQLQKEEDLYILDKPFKNVNSKVIPLPVGFEPTLHKYRLSDPLSKKLPANIFVGSMADLFGAWVPDEWIIQVFEACKAAPWHNYMFLTKNPSRYVQLMKSDLLPKDSNMWYGVSAGNKSLLKNALAIGELQSSYKTFLSIEPLHENITQNSEWKEIIEWGSFFDWVIIGAETGNNKNKVSPKKIWINKIIADCENVFTPIFLKANLANIWGGSLIQEFPKKLTSHSWEHRPCHKVFVEEVRDKKNCRQCKEMVQGKPAWRISARYYICEDCFNGGSR